MFAPSPKTRGGINSVVNAYRHELFWEEYRCKWISTYRDGNTGVKLAYFVLAWIRALALMPWYDIVHIHFSLPSSARRKMHFFRMAKLLRKKIVIHLHCGDQLPRIWGPMYERMFREADCSLVLSEAVRSRIDDYLEDHGRLEVLYNPCPKVSPVAPYSQRRKEILVAGTINRNKAWQDIIPAWAKVAAHWPDWRLVFAGNGEITAARDLAAKYEVSEQVSFPGWLEKNRKAEAFQGASMLCMASYEEGFPMAVLDAFAYGLPVISSLVGGIRDLQVRKDPSVRFFEAGDINELSEAFDALIADEALREAMSKASLAYAQGLFSLDRILKQLGTIYEGLI